MTKYAIPMAAILDFKVKSYVHEVANICIELLGLKNIFLCIKTLFIARLVEKILCSFVFQQNRRSQFLQMGGTHVQIAITPCSTTAQP